MDRPMEIISRYTDQQAIEDGYLVDISPLNLTLNHRPLNRMTRNLWERFQPFIKSKADPYLPTLRHTLQTKIKMASLTPDNPDGYMLLLPPNLWAVLNEVSGYTLMLPEDY